MTYEEALKYIDSTVWLGSRPGLERITKLMGMMGDPQNGLKYIHVAGTNGKGSFCAMTASILREAGYHTGLYTSPYIKDFNERMNIDGENIGNDELAEITEYVKSFADRMGDTPTEFELITAIGFEYFKRHKCDVVVLECGMGGRLDATNVIKEAVLSVVTGIALDHTKILGDTVEKIAAEKAGIFRSGRPVHWGGRDENAEKVIIEKAQALGCPYHKADYTKLCGIVPTLDGTTFDYDGNKNMQIGLLGLYQPENAASVISTIPLLRKEGFIISDDAVRNGLLKTRWMARFEKLRNDPLVIYDGSHNPQGMTVAVESIKKLFGGEKVNIFTGVLKDKDYKFMAGKLAEVCRDVFTVTPDNPRALSCEEYAQVFRSLGKNAESFDVFSDGVVRAYEQSKKDGVPLIALGSLYMYGDFCRALDKLK